ncbi:MAG TPA: carboxylating nicotinate-nucleotide diphosphorylase [Verrucomicrobiae bacterium]|nr:carboxylating nicotinate-nucleotide diphosphorylase [Verrucomicrobiae bacterium]
MTTLDPEFVHSIVRAALAEDVGAGDITTASAIPADARAEAYIVAKEACVVAGLPLVESVFAELDRDLNVGLLAGEGDKVEEGERVCRLAGSARAILTGERTALNFLQRLSGIATLTRQFVDLVAQASVPVKPRILDTRKTTPTLRALEKYAVEIGGGENHRMGLFDAVMIKDNHRAILARLGLKSLGDAVATARKNYPHVPIIIEADTLEQVEEALADGANHILLDNMTPDELRDAVKLVAGRAKTEASGGVTLDTVRAIAGTGVDYISVGALTHSARAVDFSLELAEGAA